MIIMINHYNDYNDQFGKVEKSTLTNFMSIYVVSHCHDYKNHHLDQNIPSQETSFWSPTDKNTSRPVLKINFVIGKEESGRKGSERTIIRKKWNEKKNYDWKGRTRRKVSFYGNANKFEGTWWRWHCARSPGQPWKCSWKRGRFVKMSESIIAQRSQDDQPNSSRARAEVKSELEMAVPQDQS